MNIIFLKSSHFNEKLVCIIEYRFNFIENIYEIINIQNKKKVSDFTAGICSMIRSKQYISICSKFMVLMM
jgi:hypothetical protein